MIKYRFKTEKELITEFGEEWFDVLPKTCWNTSNRGMNYLFGTELKLNWYKNNLINNRLKFNNMDYIIIPCFNGNSSRWVIRTDVIKEIGVDYNEKRILVYD